MFENTTTWGCRVVVAVAAVALGVALLAPTSTAAHAGGRKKKGKKAAPPVISIDLSALELEGDPALTLELPPTLWRAMRVEMLNYPRTGQLSAGKAPRVASRWLQAEESDGLVFTAEIFVVAERREGNSLRDWARRIANESDGVFPFEDARFDGPWIINEMLLKVAAKKRLRGYMLENSGGRVGMENRYVWQFALLPFPEGAQVMIGVKRVSPTTWPGGRGPGGTAGGSGGFGDEPTAGGGAGDPADGTGATDDGTRRVEDKGDDAGDAGESTGEKEPGDGQLADGVGGGDGLGDSATEPNSNQTRASTELFRSVLAGLHLKVPSKLEKDVRRFRLRDEWIGANGALTSRHVGIDVPATWRTTPTTELQGRDRIEWTEHDDDGAVAAIYRVEFVSPKLTGDIARHATVRMQDWGIDDSVLEKVETRDGTSQAALEPTDYNAAMPTDPPAALLVAIWTILMVSIVISLVLHRLLVRGLLERDPEAWESEGRPLWILPAPRQEDIPGGYVRKDFQRSNLTLMRWLIRTPDWARREPDARRTLWRLRALQLIGLACVASWIALLAPDLFGGR